MWRGLSLLILTFWLLAAAVAQQDSPPAKKPAAPPPPQTDRDREAGESSSRDRIVDIAPPKDDDKSHPYSRSAVADAEGASEGKSAESSDVQEFHPWDPHRAAKDIEVGDFYFKKKNYRAALDRYKEALYYKDNDALATFRMAQCQEKLDQAADAVANYQAYLKILPEGPFAADAHKAIERLAPQTTSGPGKK
jgi:tetratricopeptide (TPR) repeat protein